AIVNLDDLDAVMIVAHPFNSVVKGCNYFLLCVRCEKRKAVGEVTAQRAVTGCHVRKASLIVISDQSRLIDR
ncbi:hypothetical protein NFS00_24060, partial [Enterobacter hormaechei]|uniref:hypothetical protein n=1 Tax=Enterobacter hormaechei TaxID=158836 RepID=UPI002092CD07